MALTLVCFHFFRVYFSECWTAYPYDHLSRWIKFKVPLLCTSIFSHLLFLLFQTLDNIFLVTMHLFVLQTNELNRDININTKVIMNWNWFFCRNVRMPDKCQNQCKHIRNWLKYIAKMLFDEGELLFVVMVGFHVNFTRFQFSEKKTQG